MKSLTILVLAVSVSASLASSCELNLDLRTGQYPPIYLKDGTFLFPEERNEDAKRILAIESGETLDILCHGSTNKPSSISGLDPSITQTTLSCSSTGRWSWPHSASLDILALSCTANMEPNIVRTPASGCSEVGADGRVDNLDDVVTVQIGWTVNDQFVEQINLCVDEKMYATLRTRHEVVGKSIDLRDITSGRPSFRRDITRQTNLFSKFPSQSAIESSYTKDSQKDCLLKLMRSLYTRTGHRTIETEASGTHYFAKGHLAPDAAFVYDVFQDATYYFSNVAPQFQSFNNGNWKALEGAVRKYATMLAETLPIWTGTFGTLAYDDLTYDKKPKITLYNENNHTWIPAPEYYWKVIHIPSTNQAVAFIGVNDPHTEARPEPLCTNVCSGISFATWNIDDQDSGYMNCCSVEELREKISYLPDLRDENGNWPDVLKDVKEEEPIPEGTCGIDLDLVTGEHPPLLIQGEDFIYPERETTVAEDVKHRFVYVADDAELTVLCHGLLVEAPLTLIGLPGNKVTDRQTVHCQNGVFKAKESGLDIDMEALTCSNKNWADISVIHGFPGGAPESVDGRTINADDLAHITIGWRMPGGEIKPQIEICQDTRSFVTLWTAHEVIGKAISFRDTSGGRPDFRKDEPGYSRMFWGFPTISSLSNSYTKRYEAKKMVAALTTNTRPDGEYWVETAASGTHYFARGHLAPDAAFVYNAFQDATYFFANVAPQWQSFNNGNWKALEGAVRDYATETKNNIKVYTGTYGILTLRDPLNKSKRIYLYTTGGAKFISAPLYYWKVLHNPVTHQAIAFIGVNNPYLTSTPSPKCKNVCDRLSWVDWDLKDLDKGFMYCCEVHDFREYVEYLPDLSNEAGEWPELLADR